MNSKGLFASLLRISPVLALLAIFTTLGGFWQKVVLRFKEKP